jgi:FkbM family methyltransferase
MLNRLKHYIRVIQEHYRSAPQSLEDQLYEALIERGDVVYDIGANYGSVSLYMAHLTGLTGQVFAFEPIPNTYQKLCRNIRYDFRLNKAKITPLQVGVSDVEQVAVFNLPGDASQSASLAQAEQWQQALGAAMPPQSHIFECQCVTLDGLIASGQIAAPHMIKIDVEGAELLVLHGAAKLLKSPKPPIMLIEVFAPWERAFGYTPWDVFEVLIAAGYHIVYVCPDGLRDFKPSREHPTPPEYEKGYNIIAYIQGKHDGRMAGLRPLFAGNSGHLLLPMLPAPMPNQ